MASQKKLMPGHRRFTYVDYLDFPDDGQRYEILDGEVFVTPSPIPDHQRVSRCIQQELMAWAEAHPPTEVFYAPIDLILADDTILVPDLLVILERSVVTSRGIEAAPALVVEILSPSTRGRDRGLKRERYARAGVEEYWIVDPSARTIELYVLQDGSALRAEGSFQDTDVVRSKALAGFQMAAARAFRNLDPM